MNKRTLISLFLVLLFAVSPLTLFSAAENDGTVTIVAFGDSIAAAGTWEAYFKDLSGEALKNAISDYIRKKDGDLVGKMVSQGTTPRRLTDLIGSLCDLTSGSGDKGTPIIWIQGYFDNYTA